MTENMLQLRSQTPSESEFQILQTVSKNAAASGLYGGIGNEQKIFMVLLAARELGIPPMQALNGGIWNIQGKIEISSRMMNGMIRRAGHSVTVKHCDANKCVIEGRRSDTGDTFCAQFTLEDASKAGLTGKTNWKNYAEDMLYSRAMSRLARRLFPDVIGTAYVEGEIRDTKCEIIETKMLQESDPQIEGNMLTDYLKDFSEDVDMIKEYLQKYATYWKKSMTQTLEDYQDREKFEADFSKWKAKELAKAA